MSPRMKARMHELGLHAADLAGIAGSGAAGRVTIEDFEKYITNLEKQKLTQASTMRVAVADAIVDRQDLINLTVFTPGLNIALALERAIPRIEVVVTGGTLRPQKHSLVGPNSTLILDQIRATFGFLGCNGIDPSHGIVGLSLPDAALKQAKAQDKLVFVWFSAPW